MYKSAFLKSLLFMLFAFGTESVLACSYGASTVCSKYADSALVLVGKIESVESSPDDQTVVVKVEKVFKGQKVKKIVLNQPFSLCDPDFSDNVGETRLFYIVRDRKTKLYSALIPGTGGRVEQMHDELYWLNNLPMSLKRTRLAGNIELWTEGRGHWTVDPFRFVKNVPGIKVRIFNEKKSFELVTDQNGVYEFWDIPPGKYQVDAVLPPDLLPRLDMEKGSIGYDSLKKTDPKSDGFLIEINGNDCGGVDFVVNQKPKN